MNNEEVAVKVLKRNKDSKAIKEVIQEMSLMVIVISKMPTDFVFRGESLSWNSDPL